MIRLAKLLSPVLVITIAFSLTACGSGNKPNQIANTGAATGNKVKIKFLSLTTDENRTKINENYIKKNLANEMPNVELEFDAGGGGTDYQNKLKTYNASGDLPDVWFSEQNLSTVVISAGNALELTPYVTKDGFLDKFKDKTILNWKDNKIYAVHPGADQMFTPTIFYHKDIFSKNNVQVPKTFDEFIRVCQTLKSNGVVPFTTFGKGGWGASSFLLQQLIMAEDPMVAQDLVAGKTDFSNAVVKNALGRIQKMAQSGVFAQGISNLDYGPAIEMFTSNKAAMYGLFTWELSNLVAKCPDVDFMAFPSCKDGVDTTATVQYWGAPLSGYLVSAKTKNADAAVKFAEYCATQDAVFYNTENKAPTILNTGIKIDGMSPLAQKHLDTFNAAKTKIPTLYSSIYNAKMSAEIDVNNAKLLTGSFSPDDFIKAINPIWAENFKQ